LPNAEPRRLRQSRPAGKVSAVFNYGASPPRSRCRQTRPATSTGEANATCTWRLCCSAAPWSASASSQTPESILVFSVVVGAAPPVLVRNRTPAPDCHWLLRHDPVLLQRIALVRLDDAARLPVIPEIEDVPECLAKLTSLATFSFAWSARQVRARTSHLIADQPPITLLKVVQMRKIPPRERRIDRLRELPKRMRRTNQKDPPPATGRTRPHDRRASPP
jgi:hypothetical protein